MAIKKVGIIGMGALGLLFGDIIQKNMGEGVVEFIMDSRRYFKHKDEKYFINGIQKNFVLRNCNDHPEYDLIIVATKYNGLMDAAEQAKMCMNQQTIVISLLNGIISEEIIARKVDDLHIIRSVAIGMDALRDGNRLDYGHTGVIQFGSITPPQQKLCDDLEYFFQISGVPHERKEDILHAMWGKLLLNVGINQTCMVYDTTYSGALTIPAARQDMFDAMHEVIAVAQAENISLTEQDFEYYVSTLDDLVPDSYPSMRQDRLARRRSEVDLFAGTILKLAKKHGIDTPVNQKYYDKVLEIESQY